MTLYDFAALYSLMYSGLAVQMLGAGGVIVVFLGIPIDLHEAE